MIDSRERDGNAYMKEEKFGCVILADRNFALTEGVRGLLETVFETVVTVADLNSLLESAGRLDPDLTLVDMSLVGNGSLSWMSDLRERCPRMKMIALSVHDEPGARKVAITAGCDALVLKRTIGSELVKTIEDVMKGSWQQPPESDVGDHGQ